MIGQEGDTRKFKRLRSTDYYEAKAAVQAEKRQPHSLPLCKNCGQSLTGQNFNGYCLLCKDEPL
jgi:hypothetical protein